MNAMSHSTIVAAYTALLGLLSPVVDAQSLPPEI